LSKRRKEKNEYADGFLCPGDDAPIGRASRKEGKAQKFEVQVRRHNGRVETVRGNLTPIGKKRSRRKIRML